MPSTAIIAEETPRQRKKHQVLGKGRVLTAQQLMQVLREYNTVGDDGRVRTVKVLAEQMGVTTSMVNEAIGHLREAKARLNHIKKDEHYKTLIKQLQKQNPTMFERK